MAYKGPGVFIKEVQNPNPVQIPGSLRTVGIAGKGSSTYLLSNVEVVKGYSSSDTITGTLTGDVSSVYGVGSLPGLYDYTQGVDYTVSDNAITWISSSKPTDGSTYYVTFYKVKGASFYEATTFYSLDDVRAFYGDESYGGVVNEVTLAASLAFKNGAEYVVCVQQNGTTTQAEQDAIDLLEAEEIDYLVAPGMTSTTLQAYAKAHVDKMSSETQKKERMFFTSGLTLTASVADLTTRAQAFTDELVTVVAPSQCNIIITDALCNTDITTTVSGAYMGAAVAGVMSNPNYDEGEPITNKVITGIDSFNGVKYKESEMNVLGNAGVTVITNNGGIFRVRHGLTTNTSNVNTLELQVVNIKNSVKKQLRTVLAPYIGTRYVTAETNALLSAAVKSFCDQKVNGKVFTQYRNVSVTQNTSDPRIAQINFEYMPVYTTTWINVTFSLYIA